MTQQTKPKRYYDTKADAQRAALALIARLPGSGWKPDVGTNTGRGGWYWSVRLGCLTLYEHIESDGRKAYGCLLSSDPEWPLGGSQFWTPGDEFCGAPLHFATPEEAIECQMAAARAFVARVSGVVAAVDAKLHA